jgi:hypothetical protein
MNRTDEICEGALEAMKRAAINARKLAAEKGLKIPVWKNGKTVYEDPTKSLKESAAKTNSN